MQFTKDTPKHGINACYRAINLPIGIRILLDQLIIHFQIVQIHIKSENLHSLSLDQHVKSMRAVAAQIGKEVI